MATKKKPKLTERQRFLRWRNRNFKDNMDCSHTHLMLRAWQASARAKR